MEQQQRAREDGIAYECGWQIFLTITPWTLRAASADMLEMYKMRSSLGIAINIEKDKSYQREMRLRNVPALKARSVRRVKDNVACQQSVLTALVCFHKLPHESGEER